MLKNMVSRFAKENLMKDSGGGELFGENLLNI
jgi:hypothetical protein